MKLNTINNFKALIKKSSFLRNIKRTILNPDISLFLSKNNKYMLNDWRGAVSKFCNKLRYIIQSNYFVQKALFYFSAPGITIEISGLCNAKCLYCCQGSKNHKTKTAFMKCNDFKKIIDRCLDLNLVGKHNNTIALYNWGEPFLNPHFNKILNILKENNLKAAISSNFIKEPIMDIDNYKTIDNVIFSMCSLKPDRYKRIYGADLDKVLNNFNKFLDNRSKYAPEMSVKVNWIRYKFNDDELEQVQQYFKQKNVPLLSQYYYAYLNDGYDLINYLSKGYVEGYDVKQIECDIDIDRFNKISSIAPKKFFCTLKNSIVVTESGQLSLCCNVTAKNKEYGLGNFLDLDMDKILKLKRRQKICRICENLHIPFIFAFQGTNI